ncbi:hypothetical protein FJ208_01970 [Candidatus Gribaldobacteria bacterium]|nr:hypothetical protein [Candidatus Gribaldobacteria bacterium]
MQEELNKIGIKKFSKEFYPDERKKLALQIKEKRRPYFERQKELTHQVKQLVADAQEKKRAINDSIEEIEELEQSLDKRKKSIFLEILNYFEIKKLKKEICNKVLNKDQFEDEYQQISASLQSIARLFGEKQELAEARNILNDFYESKSKEWQEYKEEEGLRKVDAVMENYQVAIIHGIHPNFIPGDNSLLHSTTDWQIKLKILLVLEPSLSSSTIQNGDSYKNMWSRMGVILNGGMISLAMPNDSGTVAKSFKKRIMGPIKKPEKISNQIREAIEERGKHNYNELSIDDPKVAGFYICLDKFPGIRQDLVPIEEIIQEISKYGLPLYVIQDGAINEAEYNKESGTIISKKKITLKEIAKKQFNFSSTQREKIKEELFVDPPFKLSFVEAKYAESRFYGGAAYIEINAVHNLDLFSGEMVKYKHDPRGEYGDFIINETGEQDGGDKHVRTIQILQGVGCKIQYYNDDGKLLRRTKRKSDGSRGDFRGSERRYIKKFDEHESGCINLTNFMIENLGRSINTNHDYLLGMEERINYWQAEKDRIKKEAYDGQIDFCDSVLRELAYHLYGFGEQAEEFHDIETKERACGLAERVVARKDYKDFLATRIDKDGSFMINEKDAIFT